MHRTILQIFYRVCFFPLVSTRFRKVLGPTINTGGRTPKNANARGGRLRGLLKAPGSLVIGHSGGLGSTVLLDLVAKSYFYRSTTIAGDDSSTLGTEHPRNKAKEDGGSADVWKGNPAVCYVEVASAIPGVRVRVFYVTCYLTHVPGQGSHGGGSGGYSGIFRSFDKV